MIKRLALAALLAVCASSANANYLRRGNELYDYCTRESAYEHGVCVGMIIGWYENMQLAYNCPDQKHITVGQLEGMVIKELRDHPEHRNDVAAGIATNVFIRDFKCEKRAEPESP